jgi:hypothetical protein
LAAVAWNYFDAEHLTVAHSVYPEAKVLYEKPPLLVLLQTYRLPLLGFLKSHSLSTVVVEEQSPELLRFRQFNMGFLSLPSISEFECRALTPDRTRVTVRYKFLLRGWRRLLAPFLPRLMARWNDRVWAEDLPLKLRRHKVLRLGFQDFVGLPEKVADRRRDGVLPWSLPVPRPPGAPIDELR